MKPKKPKLKNSKKRGNKNVNQKQVRQKKDKVVQKQPLVITPQSSKSRLMFTSPNVNVSFNESSEPRTIKKSFLHSYK